MTNSKVFAAFMVALAFAGNAVNNAVHADEMDGAFGKQVPRIELDCDQIGGVVFWDTGELVGENVKGEYVDFVDQTIYFTNGIRLKGEKVNDSILFDRSTLITKSGSFACVGE